MSWASIVSMFLYVLGQRRIHAFVFLGPVSEVLSPVGQCLRVWFGSVLALLSTAVSYGIDQCLRRWQSPVFICFGFSFSFSSRWHRSSRKGPYALRPVSQQSPQGCPRNRVNICLVEHRSFSTLEGGMPAASFLHSSFLLNLQYMSVSMTQPLVNV